MIWPIDPPASDLDEPDHGSRCGCEECWRDREAEACRTSPSYLAAEEESRMLDAADAADRTREDADEDRDIDAGAIDCDDIDF